MKNTVKSIETKNYTVKMVELTNGDGFKMYAVIKEKPEGNVESTPTFSFDEASNLFETWLSKIETSVN